MFKPYKPKGDRVKAVQVSAENAEEIAKLFLGRVAYGSAEPTTSHGSGVVVEEVLRSIVGVDIPTFDGAQHLKIGSWVIRTASDQTKFMSDGDFNEQYESSAYGPRGVAA